jgi:hypothetical protein
MAQPTLQAAVKSGWFSSPLSLLVMVLAATLFGASLYAHLQPASVGDGYAGPLALLDRLFDILLAGGLARVMIVGAQMSYGLNRDFIADISLDQIEWRRLLVRNPSLPAVHDDLKQRGITHMLVSYGIFTWGAMRSGKGSVGGCSRHRRGALIITFSCETGRRWINTAAPFSSLSIRTGLALFCIDSGEERPVIRAMLPVARRPPSHLSAGQVN